MIQHSDDLILWEAIGGDIPLQEGKFTLSILADGKQLSYRVLKPGEGTIINLLDLDQPIKPLSAGGGIKMLNRVLAFTLGVALLHTTNDLPYV